MPLSHVDTSEVAILSRVLEPDKPSLSPQAARDILAFDFSPDDKDCMRQLSAKARAGTLTPEERAVIDNYERVGHLLNIMQSKARRFLKSRRDTKGPPLPQELPRHKLEDQDPLSTHGPRFGRTGLRRGVH